MPEYERILSYQSAVEQARIMLRKGVITPIDIVSIEDKLAQKYGLKYGSIYREIDLINIENRGNISHYKEVI